MQSSKDDLEFITHAKQDIPLLRDIPKIIKFKATTSLRVSCLFCIFKHSVRQEVV